LDAAHGTTAWPATPPIWCSIKPATRRRMAGKSKRAAPLTSTDRTPKDVDTIVDYLVLSEEEAKRHTRAEPLNKRLMCRGWSLVMVLVPLVQLHVRTSCARTKPCWIINPDSICPTSEPRLQAAASGHRPIFIKRGARLANRTRCNRMPTSRSQPWMVGLPVANCLRYHPGRASCPLSMHFTSSFSDQAPDQQNSPLHAATDAKVVHE